MRLSLDHLTVVDAPPEDLATIAAETGCAGVCLFLHRLEVLPHMARFDLVADAEARRRVRSRCRDLGLAIDLVYPFTITARSRPDDFLAPLDAATELGAEAINVLVYDGDPARRAETLGGVVEQAARRGLAVSLEFYPASRVRSLAEALDLVERVGPAHRLGVTVDLLHLMRSGGTIDDLAGAPSERLRVAQLCDGAASVADDDLVREAAQDRLLPGEGVFDVAGFVGALPATTRLTVEVPRDRTIETGASSSSRGRAAVAATRRALAPGTTAL